jgi:UDP-glucose 4-epimerase
MTTTAWLIGSGGLLGGALTKAIAARSGWTLHQASPVPWRDDDVLVDALRLEFRRLLSSASQGSGNWRILWAAGAAVTSTGPDMLARELCVFRGFLEMLEAELTASDLVASGGIFYASSAGGVYAGSAYPPFTEGTTPVPLSGYGKLKLDAEASLDAFSRASGVSVLKGRIANLYGPGQRLDKMQGLISHIALAHLAPSPASIFVSLDTIRDYIFVDDCAQLICDAVDRLGEEAALSAHPIQVVKNLSSGAGVTIATILSYFRTLTKGHPNVMLGSSASASFQARDLRVTSTVWPELDRRALTPMPVGIHATIGDLRRAMQLSRSEA